MTKPPEEGEIWEWRAFGNLSSRLVKGVRAYPIRMGIIARREEDIYFISSTSDQNVKLRKTGGEWVLKFKLLLETRLRSIELYSEGLQYLFNFPVGREAISLAAALLHTKIAEAATSKGKFHRDEFIRIMGECSPPVVKVETAKVRSQFQMDGGWVELADVMFSRRRVQSISIQSPHIEAVEEILDLLKPGSELEPMNYVEACRRWA